MAKTTYYAELEQFTSYLKSSSNEDAKRADLFPLFKKLYKDKVKSESDAKGADVYVEGKLIVECKSTESQWVDGFYQALHYHRKHGLVYNTVMVVAHKFVAIWKLNSLPEFAVLLARNAELNAAPNAVGKENARKTAQPNRKLLKEAAIYWLTPKDLEGNIFDNAKNLLTESYEILKILNNLEVDRFQINKHNFIQTIEALKPLFEHPIDAVHAFYTAVGFWDIASKAAINEEGNEVRVIGFNGSKNSDAIEIHPRKAEDFKRFVDTRYIFTNEGSGLTVDYYFSRFDEVMAKIDPEYVKQHGIFFTDSNLSKFALWFAKYHFPGNINDDYIVFDPAGGSGNLVSSWRGKLKHKIVSELQPDLLRTIDRRMKADPFHIETGFTIIPKTSENKGLNFLDRSGQDYLNALKNELARKNITLDKPLAFLLNPPYKNTDENSSERESKDAEYEIHQSIYELTGEDAGKERYLAFLGQILNIAKAQAADGLKPVVLIFTPTSWLIPRPTYVSFRAVWDAHFRYHSGFITKSSEFFKIDGKWPLAFTIWQYEHNQSAEPNCVQVTDLTELTRPQLQEINWNLASEEELNNDLNNILAQGKYITLDNSRGDIRELLPKLERNEIEIRQPRFDFSHAKKASHFGSLVSGFPLDAKRLHFELKRKCGDKNGSFIGFMDDNTPVRLIQEPCNRLSNLPDRVWFRLDNDFKGMNKSKSFSGSPDNRGYCGYDLESAKATFTWFAITKALNGNYPLWANQYDIWAPKTTPELQAYWHALCFAFVLAENRCVVTKFEANNPVQGAPEVFVDNPLCPTNPKSFWCTTLAPHIVEEPVAAKLLVDKITALYKHWNTNYCKGQNLTYVGLQDEAYFKYFSYPDFLTPYSGLIQIKKYSEINGSADLQEQFSEISALTKSVKEEIHRLLVNEFSYFA